MALTSIEGGPSGTSDTFLVPAAQMATAAGVVICAISAAQACLSASSCFKPCQTPLGMYGTPNSSRFGRRPHQWETGIHGCPGGPPRRPNDLPRSTSPMSPAPAAMSQHWDCLTVRAIGPTKTAQGRPRALGSLNIASRTLKKLSPALKKTSPWPKVSPDALKKEFFALDVENFGEVVGFSGRHEECFGRNEEFSARDEECLAPDVENSCGDEEFSDAPDEFSVVDEETSVADEENFFQKEESFFRNGESFAGNEEFSGRHEANSASHVENFVEAEENFSTYEENYATNEGNFATNEGNSAKNERNFSTNEGKSSIVITRAPGLPPPRSPRRDQVTPACNTVPCALRYGRSPE